MINAGVLQIKNWNSHMKALLDTPVLVQVVLNVDKKLKTAIGSVG